MSTDDRSASMSLQDQKTLSQSREEYLGQSGYDKLVVGAAIHASDSSCILLLKRASQEQDYAGIFEMPGGKVEAREKIVDGLCREVKEETDLDVVRILRRLENMTYMTKKGYRCLQLNFVVKVSHTDYRVNETEHDEGIWVTRENMNLKMSREMKATVASAFD